MALHEKEEGGGVAHEEEGEGEKDSRLSQDGENSEVCVVLA